MLKFPNGLVTVFLRTFKSWIWSSTSVESYLLQSVNSKSFTIILQLLKSVEYFYAHLKVTSVESYLLHILTPVFPRGIGRAHEFKNSVPRLAISGYPDG